MEPVNLRAKQTASDENAILGLWKERKTKVAIRKQYEDDIEQDNRKIAKELFNLFEPVAKGLDTPFEFIVETQRSVVQLRMYSSPKAKGHQFVTTMSQAIAPLEYYMADTKKLKCLALSTKLAIRRIKALIKKNLGIIICPNNRPPMGRIQDLKRQPTDPMVVVTFNVRTRYDF